MRWVAAKQVCQLNKKSPPPVCQERDHPKNRFKYILKTALVNHIQSNRLN